MIGYFPEPYPDELLYSICARFTSRMKYSTNAATVKALFGKRHAIPITDLPHKLEYLVNQLPPGAPYTVDGIIDRHTLFPYYAPFMPAQNRILVRETMKKSEFGAQHLRSGICASRIKPPVLFRSCPACDIENMTRYGETYWNRLFQITGVEVCPTHRVFLTDTEVRLASPLCRHLFTAATFMERPARRVDLDVPRDRILLQIAQDVTCLLNHKNLNRDVTFIHEQFLSLLKHSGYLRRGNFIKLEDLRNDFKEFFGKALLQELQSTVPDQKDMGWVGRLLRKPKGGRAPLHHLLMMQFLGVTSENFFSEPHLSKRAQSTANGQHWFCLNPICHHYQKPVIDTFTLKYVPTRKQEVALFVCSECGFKYSLWDWSRVATKADHVYDYGTIWHQRLREYWEDGNIGICKLANTLGADTYTIKLHAKALGLPFPRLGKRVIHASGKAIRIMKGVRRLSVESQRELFLELRKNNPGAGLKPLRAINPALVNWLYRYDKDWFNKNKPPKLRTPGSSLMADWEGRDQELAGIVATVAARIKHNPGKPRRVTRCIIGKEIGKYTLLNVHLKELPLTKSVLEAVAESPEQFGARRVAWVANQLFRNKGSFQRWELVRAAGLRKQIELSPPVQAELDYQTVRNPAHEIRVITSRDVIEEESICSTCT